MDPREDIRSAFRYGDSKPTPRPAYRLTVVRPGAPETVRTLLGHVPLSAALFEVGAHLGVCTVQIEPVQA